MERDLDWDGCLNARDLGGLSTTDGRATRQGAVVRSDNPARLTERGWTALHDHGVRTVVTLRTIGTEDPEPDLTLLPSGVTVERVFLEDATDPVFRRLCIGTGWWATPLQWPVMLERWPGLCADAVSTVAQAPPGGVVVSCGIGRDRTGLVTFLLLALVGVPADQIAADWSHSLTRLAGDPLASQQPVVEVLEREGTTAEDAIRDALALDVEGRLVAAGLSEPDLRAVRSRLCPDSGRPAPIP